MHRCLSSLLLTIFVVGYVASSETVLLTSNTTARRATCTGFQILELRPLYRDCSRAIDRLPSSRVPGYFHTAGNVDEYLLPVKEKVGTCKVSVQISPYWIVEAGSWGELKAVARGVNDVCRVKTALGIDVTGGEVSVGRHEGIQVRVERRYSGGEVATDV